MKFGINQFLEKTPAFMTRLSLALKTASVTALGYAVISNNQKWVLWCAIGGILASVITSFFGEPSLNDAAKKDGGQ